MAMTEPEQTQETWTNVERGFLQALMVKRVLTHADAEVVHQKFLELESSMNMLQESSSNLDTVLYMAQGALKQAGYEVKERRDQQTRHKVYIVTDPLQSEFTKQQTALNTGEMEIFKAALEAIFSSERNAEANYFWIGRDEFINEFQQRGPALANQQLDKVVAEGWLEEQMGRLYPSHRTLAELEDYLYAEYGDNGSDDCAKVLYPCAGCSRMFTMGLQCPNLDCTTRLHVTCADNYFRRNETSDCVQCRSNLKDDAIKVGL